MAKLFDLKGWREFSALLDPISFAEVQENYSSRKGEAVPILPFI